MIRIAINGFGRIGRAVARLVLSDERRRGIEIVAVNDLGSPENLAYLLRHDSVYGRFPLDVSVRGDSLIVGANEIKILSEADPANLPWSALGVDVAIESTGRFTDPTKAQAHISAGAKRVVVSAPFSSEKNCGATVLMGVNEDRFNESAVTSNASCTTNAASPVIAILDEKIGILSAVLSTTHAYTASQAVVDGPSKKGVRDGRAAAINIIPAATGAAKAVTAAYTALAGKFDGISLRVPVPAGSIADVTFIAKRSTSADEVNSALREATRVPRWEGIFSVTEEPLVSSDIVGDTHASIADLSMTRVVDGNLVKVLAWYDNEMGYAESLLRHAIKAVGANK